MATKKTDKKANTKTAKTAKKVRQKTAQIEKSDAGIVDRFDGQVARITGPAPKAQGVFNILSPEAAERCKDVQAHLLAAASRRKTNPRPVSFCTADTLQRKLLPLPHFSLQYALDAYGLPSSGVVEVIGWPSCGKTSIVFTISAHIMLTRNAPLLYMPCEGEEKQMAKERMMRCMSTTMPKVAAELLKRVHIERCTALGQLQPKMANWAKVQRDGFGPKDARVEGVPMDIPLVIVVDPFSRLLSDAEAAGNIVWDDMSKQTMHEAGTGSNFGHSKFANAWTRWLQSFCDRYNVLLICVHQQTEKIDFGSKASSNEAAWKIKLRNPNYIGGKALEGLACVSIVMALMWEVQDPQTKTIIGKRIAARVHKQAHGEGGRIIEWFLRTSHNGRDIPGSYVDPAIHFGLGTVKILKEEQMLNLRQGAEDKLYSSKDLGVRSLSADQIDAVIHARPEVLDALGRELRISGYYDPMAEFLADAEPAAPKEKAEEPSEEDTDGEGEADTTA